MLWRKAFQSIYGKAQSHGAIFLAIRGIEVHLPAADNIFKAFAVPAKATFFSAYRLRNANS